MREWVNSKLAEICHTIRAGGTPSSDNPRYYGGSIRFVTIEDITNAGRTIEHTNKTLTDAGLSASAAWLVPPRHLLYSMYATLGKVTVNLVPVATNQAILSIKTDETRIDDEYLHQYLDWIQPRVVRLAAQTTQANLSAERVRSITVHYPVSLHEQQRIADILSTVDEAIEATQALIAKTRAIKAGLMHDLFTRGVTPDGQLRPPRDQAPHLYKSSPLGWIPKEWDVVELSHVVPHATYGISSSLEDKGQTPILRMNNLSDGEAAISDLKYSSAPLSAPLFLRSGDVLFNRTNSLEHVGRTGIWRGQLPVASFASYLVRLEPDANLLSAAFLNAWLNWDATQIRIRKFATPGVHQVNINPTNLRRIKIALPQDETEQNAIVDVLDSNAAALRAHQSEVGELQQIKHGLMHDLLTGRVTVPEAADVANLKI